MLSNYFPSGISALGVKLPTLAIEMNELAELRSVDPAKLTQGLGCRQMALCAPHESVTELAVGAARRALASWGGDPSEIGLLAVGTESARDMSRPLSAFVAEQLELKGSLRSYEVKHACYGGTLALRQALEWRESGAARGRAALVIAADVAQYGPSDPGEPTGGAGAVAFVLSDGPDVARVGVDSQAYSEPAFDFWRPVGEAFPRVDGPLSLDCYQRGAVECFSEMIGERDPWQVLAELDALCFHVPFPKMVKKAVVHLGAHFGFSGQQTAELFEQKVKPTLAWNTLSGNAYTASLWLSVAGTLAGKPPGYRLSAFSYGSGFGAELLSLEAGALAAASPWKTEFEADVAGRSLVSQAQYQTLRAGHEALVVSG